MLVVEAIVLDLDEEVLENLRLFRPGVLVAPIRHPALAGVPNY
jgi:hypothetical protein